VPGTIGLRGAAAALTEVEPAGGGGVGGGVHRLTAQHRIAGPGMALALKPAAFAATGLPARPSATVQRSSEAAAIVDPEAAASLHLVPFYPPVGGEQRTPSSPGAPAPEGP